jgi:hypothetical protein
VNNLLHKSLSSVGVCACVSPIVARQRPGKNVTAGKKSKSKLLYDWRFTAYKFVLASSLSRLKTRDVFLSTEPLHCSLYVTSSLTRGLVCL